MLQKIKKKKLEQEIICRIYTSMFFISTGTVLYFKVVVFLSNSVWNSQWLLNPSPCIENEWQHRIIMADSYFNHSCQTFLHSKTMKKMQKAVTNSWVKIQFSSMLILFKFYITYWQRRSNNTFWQKWKLLTNSYMVLGVKAWQESFCGIFYPPI